MREGFSPGPRAIWAAKRGTLHLLRWSADGGAGVAEEVELPSLEFPLDPRTARIARTGTTALGDVFLIEIPDGEIFMHNVRPPVFRHRDREFALMGGLAMH